MKNSQKAEMLSHVLYCYTSASLALRTEFPKACWDLLSIALCVCVCVRTHTPQQLAILKANWFLQPFKGLSPTQDMQCTLTKSTGVQTQGISPILIPIL